MRFVSKSLTLLACGLFLLWASGVIWFMLPAPSFIRAAATGVALVWMLFIAVALFSDRFLRPAWVGFFSLAIFAFALWFLIEPRNDLNWQKDVDQLASAEVSGDLVTIRNVRNFHYRAENDFDVNWETRTYRLSELNSLDLFAVYWMGDAIAHTMLSFGFGEERVVISIEIRKIQGQQYSAIAGFFRQYHLVYTVADERDLIALRTRYRDPPEDVYLYNIDADQNDIEALFKAFLEQINQLTEQPEFYNTVTSNCTTNILTHVNMLDKNFPRSWKILLSGYLPELLYDLGLLDQSLSFNQLRVQALINTRSNAALQRSDYSAELRRH